LKYLVQDRKLSGHMCIRDIDLASVSNFGTAPTLC
jgi:hypothetical protein